MPIADLKTYPVAADNLKLLIEVTEWYDNMPACLSEVVGERFAQNVEEQRASLVPNELEVVLENADPLIEYWIADYSVRDGKMFISIENSDNEHSIEVELVPT